MTDPMTSSNGTDPMTCQRCGQVHKKCKAHNNRGGPCGLWPYRGLKVCWKHGAATERARAAGDRNVEVERIRGELVKLGRPREIDPGEALIELVWEAAGNVEWYRAQIGELEKVTQTELGVGGAVKEVPATLVAMYDAERDRLEKFSVDALKIGVEQRRLELAQADAQRLFAALVGAMTMAGIEVARQEAVRRELGKALRSASSIH